ncbi:MAG: Fur family transcriptional regulator [Candidatus Ranarchaeia archaeon]
MLQKIVEKLKSRGYKLTPQRIEIIKIIADNAVYHPSLNAVYSVIKKKMPTVSFSTLFKTVSLLEEMGLLRLFNLAGETRIEANAHVHVNIINKKTGEITDIIDERLVDELITKIGYDRKEHKNILINIILY